MNASSLLLLLSSSLEEITELVSVEVLLSTSELEALGVVEEALGVVAEETLGETDEDTKITE